MADTVATQVLLDGERNLVMKFTNQSDGTGESAVSKVAAATYGTNLRIKRIHYATVGMAVLILWDATTPILAWACPQDAAGTIDFDKFGGAQNNGGSGVTGSVKFTTVGHTAGDAYSIIIEFAKK